MALYRAISAHSSTVVSLEDTVSGKTPVSPVKWLCIGLSVHTVVQYVVSLEDTVSGKAPVSPV